MTRTQKLVALAALAALLLVSLLLLDETWMRFAAALVVAVLARAIWAAPLR